MEAPHVPPIWRLLNEGRGIAEFPRLLWNLPSLAGQPRGDGGPVLVLPGFGTGDASTALLRGYLRALGYRPRGWEMGINRGDVAALVPRVAEAAGRLHRATGRRLRMVGWSLGGVIAREIARDAPEIVERIITLGTPIVGGPKYTSVGRYYAQRGFDLDAIEAQVEERNRIPIRVPITAIYSRGDGVVAWQACIDRLNPHVENVEVRTTHLGLGFNPDVYRILASRLADREAPVGVDPR